MRKKRTRTVGLRDDGREIKQELNRLEHNPGPLWFWSHPEGECKGEYCTIHRRSDHSMRSFPQHWRSDRGIMERICNHGCGHPDPDDYRIMNGEDDGTHGCCGCGHGPNLINPQFDVE